VPFLSLSNPADAGPAILFHGEEVFKTVKVSIKIFSFLLSGLLADGVGLVDVIDAAHLQVVGAIVSGHGDCKEGQNSKKNYHQLHSF